MQYHEKWQVDDEWVTVYETYSIYGDVTDEFMTESNAAAFLARLGGESETVDDLGGVRVHRSDFKRLDEALKIMAELDDYPLLDESDFYNREFEYQRSFAEDAAGCVAEVIIGLFDLDGEVTVEDLKPIATELNMQAQSYGGNDYAIFSNQYRLDSFDDRDLEDYQRFLGDMFHVWDFADDDLYHYVCALFGVVFGEECEPDEGAGPGNPTCGTCQDEFERTTDPDYELCSGCHSEVASIPVGSYKPNEYLEGAAQRENVICLQRARERHWDLNDFREGA